MVRRRIDCSSLPPDFLIHLQRTCRNRFCVHVRQMFASDPWVLQRVWMYGGGKSSQLSATSIADIQHANNLFAFVDLQQQVSPTSMLSIQCHCPVSHTTLSQVLSLCCCFVNSLPTARLYGPLGGLQHNGPTPSF